MKVETLQEELIKLRMQWYGHVLHVDRVEFPWELKKCRCQTTGETKNKVEGPTEER
jgi:hypothetical protein